MCVCVCVLTPYDELDPGGCLASAPGITVVMERVCVRVAVEAGEGGWGGGIRHGIKQSALHALALGKAFCMHVHI